MSWLLLACGAVRDASVVPQPGGRGDGCRAAALPPAVHANTHGRGDCGLERRHPEAATGITAPRFQVLSQTVRLAAQVLALDPRDGARAALRAIAGTGASRGVTRLARGSFWAGVRAALEGIVPDGVRYDCVDREVARTCPLGVVDPGPPDGCAPGALLNRGQATVMYASGGGCLVTRTRGCSGRNCAGTGAVAGSGVTRVVALAWLRRAVPGFAFPVMDTQRGRAFRLRVQGVPGTSAIFQSANYTAVCEVGACVLCGVATTVPPPGGNPTHLGHVLGDCTAHAAAWTVVAEEGAPVLGASGRGRPSCGRRPCRCWGRRRRALGRRDSRPHVRQAVVVQGAVGDLGSVMSLGGYDGVHHVAEPLLGEDGRG